MVSNLEITIMKLHRIGAVDRAKWLETIDKRIPASYKARIVKNDKTVLKELILPNWLEWDFLREWALNDSDGETCGLCGNKVEDFIVFKDKIICKECLRELRHIR